MDVDWVGLRAAAVAAMRRAYAPYSNFPVGAAALVDDGRVVVGCNVENSSYGLGLCAECGLVSALHAGGGGRLVALACVDRTGAPLMPCGRCRQLLWEHGGAECLIDSAHGPMAMAQLLPYAFDQEALDRATPGARVGGGPRPAAVPARLAAQVGQGAVFVHPEIVAGQQLWTGYWGAEEPGGILEEAPTWARATDGVSWGRLRTARVFVVDGQGATHWAGVGERPGEVERDWPA
jgi:cytidine deaminase